MNNALYGAQLEGLFPDITFRKVDLGNIEQTGELLHETKPSVVFNSTSLQSYWVIELLPKEIHRKFQKAGYGPWVPMHLTLCYNLMQAVKQSDICTQVVNGSYPDAVNPILSKAGMAPAAGIGNLDLIIPQIRNIAADSMRVHPRHVYPMLVMHHYAEYWIVREGHTGGAPYCLKIYVHGHDVTPQLKADDIFKEIIRSAARPGRPDSHYMVASSAVQKIMAIYNNSNELSHVAGPAGMIGGYPALINSKGSTVQLPEGLSMEDAMKINEVGQSLEGIEAIHDDGSVTFTDKSCEIIKDLLGYDCKKMMLGESQERAKELNELYKAFLKKHNLN